MDVIIRDMVLPADYHDLIFQHLPMNIWRSVNDLLFSNSASFVIVLNQHLVISLLLVKEDVHAHIISNVVSHLSPIQHVKISNGVAALCVVKIANVTRLGRTTREFNTQQHHSTMCIHYTHNQSCITHTQHGSIYIYSPHSTITSLWNICIAFHHHLLFHFFVFIIVLPLDQIITLCNLQNFK